MLLEINKNILHFLNSFSNNEIIANLVYIFADAPIFFLPLFLIISWLYFTFKKKSIEEKTKLLLIFYSTVLGVLIALVIQQFVNIDRPENYLETTGKLLLKHIPDASFPSDHATISFAFLTSLFFAGYKKVFFVFLPFVIIMSISRIIAGVHWPLDILVGAIIGISSSFFVFKYLIKLEFVKKLNSFIIFLASKLKL